MKILILLAGILGGAYGSCADGCPKHSHLVPCASPCQRTCATRFSYETLCPDVCWKIPCVCDDGYIWDLDYAQCIIPDKCRVEDVVCDPGFEYNECGYLATCDNYNKDGPLDSCARGCYCKANTVFKNETQKCVKIKQC